MKEDSKEAIATIQKLGVHVTMITGDGEASAKYIGNMVGITDVIANCLPEDKATIIKGLKEKYKVVAMIGDGINDAPALALSDI